MSAQKSLAILGSRSDLWHWAAHFQSENNRRCAYCVRAGVKMQGSRSGPHIFIIHCCVLLFSKKNIRSHKGGEDYGDYAVHGKESGVELGEIIGLDQRMFVEQEERYSGYAGDG